MPLFYNIWFHMLDFIMKLISFNTTKNEKDAMKFIEKYVRNLHGNTLMYEKQEIWDQWRYNLIIKNTENPDIILAGHVDTVPELSKDQFIPKIEGNRLYWRGAVDMKAGVAINISLIEYMIKNKIKFRVLCYADEEYNFLWMKKFVEVHTGKIHPKLTIVTEPTNAKIYTGFRGVAALYLEIKGKSVHSALKNLGINAIEEYIYFIEHIEKYIQSKDIHGYVSLTNLASIQWGIYKNGEIICQYNIVPNVAKGNFSLRLWNNLTYEEFKLFMYEYFGKKWVEVIDIQTKIWYNPLIQNELIEKYSKYGEVELWYTFGYSDIQLIKRYIGGDCLLIWPWPLQLAHQDEEYVEIDSIEKSKKIIESILNNFFKQS